MSELLLISFLRSFCLLSSYLLCNYMPYSGCSDSHALNSNQWITVITKNTILPQIWWIFLTMPLITPQGILIEKNTGSNVHTFRGSCYNRFLNRGYIVYAKKQPLRDGCKNLLKYTRRNSLLIKLKAYIQQLF